MYDILKIPQAFEDSNVLLKGITKKIENEKRTKARILGEVIRYCRS